MDEAEKYKQRLEAIAEKRRLQEEQDKARRDMEDEKLRLQQLKRKSLRDQWLMEGAPLSPTSPDSQSPRSPLWGTQAQEMEKHIDKLQSESQRLSEEREKLEKQIEDGQMEAVKVTEDGAKMVRVVVQNGENGENNATSSETTEDEVKENQSPVLDEPAVILTNGGGELEANHSPAEHNNQPTTNGPVEVAEGVVSVTLETGIGVSEAEPGQVSNVSINEEEEEEEEEEGTLVMRAECVIITDEGDDQLEELTSQEDQQESMQSDKSPLLDPEACKEGREAPVEEVVKTEPAPETSTEPENSEAAELTAEAQPGTEDGDMQGSIKVTEAGDGETNAEDQDKTLEDPASVQLQSPALALEGSTVAMVPVYTEMPPSTFSPEPEGEVEASATPEGAESALKAEDPACLPGQFQDVPLADPRENQRTEAGPGEQEPLLLKAKAPDTKAEPAATNSPVSTETQSPTRAGQGGETEAPKHKSCQCCSVM